jgi:L-aminopeptidase/D-esterase-like protein
VLTDVAGVQVGHWTDRGGATGCTVVVLPPGTVASGEVRGGAPATREFALLDAHRTVANVDAVVLTGGSALGLSACDGVCRALRDRGRGFRTGGGPVPIVVGMSLFDLLEGDGPTFPGPAEGVAALDDAETATVPEPVLEGTGLAVASLGRVGAASGATVGKWRGRQHLRPGGMGCATARHGAVVVSALVAVNAFGDVDLGDSGSVGLEELPVDLVTGAFGPLAVDPLLREEVEAWGEPGTNTTLGVVVTNARLAKGECLLVAQGAHDGYARALFPAHTRVDGDAVVVAATGALDAPADVDLVRLLGVRAVEAAIRSVAR